MFVSKQLIRLLLVGALIAIISGCAAVQTSIAKRNLDVQTRISTAIFVDAVKRQDRVVYVDIRSGVMEFDRNAFRKAVVAEFANNGNGYRITDDPDAAQYQMNIFVTKLEKASPTAADVALSKGYGGDVGAGAALGATMGSRRGSASSTVGGGILGALGTTAANAFYRMSPTCW